MFKPCPQIDYKAFEGRNYSCSSLPRTVPRRALVQELRVNSGTEECVCVNRSVAEAFLHQHPDLCTSAFIAQH